MTWDASSVTKTMAKTRWDKLDKVNSSWMNSRQICIDGMPRTAIGMSRIG